MAATLKRSVSSSRRLRSSDAPPWVSDHPGGTAGQRDRMVARELESPQHHQADQVARVEAVGGRIDAVVQGDRTGDQPVGQGEAVGAVMDQPAGVEIGQEVHPA